MKSLRLKGLVPGQKAFTLDTGEVLLVTITALPIANGHAALRVESALIDPKTKGVITPLDEIRFSIPFASLALAGSLDGHIKRARQQAATQAGHHLLAVRLLGGLPPANEGHA